MYTGMLIILVIGCLALTISLYEVFRKSPPPLRWIARLIELNPLFSFAFNFAVSFVLTMFIGVGMVAGAANLVASIIFPFYSMARKRSDPVQIGLKKSTHGQEGCTPIARNTVSPESSYTGSTTSHTGRYGKTKTEAAGEAVGKVLKKSSVYGYRAGKAVVKGGSGFVRGLVRSIKRK